MRTGGWGGTYQEVPQSNLPTCAGNSAGVEIDVLQGFQRPQNGSMAPSGSILISGIDICTIRHRFLNDREARREKSARVRLGGFGDVPNMVSAGPRAVVECSSFSSLFECSIVVERDGIMCPPKNGQEIMRQVLRRRTKNQPKSNK